MSLIGTQQERRHQLVHREAADAATKHMTEDAHLKMVRKTGRSTNKKQHAVGCEYLHTAVSSRQLTV
jgi:seryl-tRNA(Sec) selenium transferase